MPVRAVLLDFDGTMVDSEPLHWDSWNQAVKPYGGGMGWEKYQRRLVGITDREAGRILLEEAGRKPDVEIVEAARDAKKKLYQTRFCQELTIDGRVLGWLSKWSSVKSIGVVSSSLVAEVEPLLVKCGLRPSLELLVCSDDVERHKPAPDPYLLALRKLNRNGASISADECLVFEDSDAGVKSAECAGMRVRRVQSPDDLPLALAEESRLW